MTGTATAASPGSGERAEVIRRAVAIGSAAGVFGLSFGALSITAGLGVAQVCGLSLLVYSGASQFAFVAVAAAGGAPAAGVLAALLLGARNGLYGLRLAPLLQVAGWRRILAAHLVSDESAAMALSRSSEATARLAFWATGVSVFVFWNAATLVGALGGQLVKDPDALGLDAAISGAFLALVAPRLKEPGVLTPTAVAVALCLATVPVLPVGFPILAAAVGVFAFSLLRPARLR